MRWELALVQHPMYLLIREDTICAERTPPWGAPTIEEYIARVKENLVTLDKYPRLKLGYEWSGVELELLKQDAPEVIEAIRAYSRAGRIRFYNGTYAQPHLQMLSSEANLRQFQFGQRVYEELSLEAVKVYAHQEASVHDQVPQLLNAFGITYGVIPGFLANIVWLEQGEMLLHGVRGPRFLKDRQFVSWQGLDGSRTPLFMHQPIPREMTLQDMLSREFVLGSLSAPSLFIDLPDMIGIDDQWMDERKAMDFVLLDSALNDRDDSTIEYPRVRLFTNWSYVEGIRAEELSRCNWQAEHEALSLEAMNSVAYAVTQHKPDSTDQFWKTILKCQHHDVYCFSAPELKDKSIRWLKETIAQTRKLSAGVAAKVMTQIDTSAVPGQPVCTFNVLPHIQTGLVEIETEVENAELYSAQEASIPCEVLPEKDGVKKLRFLTGLKGLGYTVFWVRESKEKRGIGEHTASTAEIFENQYYGAIIRPDGTFSSLVIKPSGTELIDTAKGFGNSLRATDSHEISFTDEPPEQRIERYISDPPVRGPQLDWTPTASASVRDTLLGRTFSVSGAIGDRIRADLMIHLYHQHNRIDFQWDFNFDNASVGTFFDEYSKLLVCWPLKIDGSITHDIPFGVIQERPDRSFFPASWIDLSDGECGFAYFHQGTPRHWVSECTLFNLLAWGEQTDAIHNGMGRYQWLKSFDQRLNGCHTIRYAIYPHPGDWQPANLVKIAREYGFPPLVYPVERHNGTLPPAQSIMELVDPAISATSVQVCGEELICRVYNADDLEVTPESSTQLLTQTGLRRINGESTEVLHSFEIGELIFKKMKNN